MHRKAEQLTKFTEGMFYAEDIHKKGIDAFRDGAVWGTGILHIYAEDKEIKVERAFPQEFFVDQYEALSAPPRQLHRAKIVDRDLMIAWCEENIEDKKEREEALHNVRHANNSSFIDIGGVGTASDMIVVVESWHLPSSKNANDGVHAICVEDSILFKEEWEKDYFPFAFFHYNKRLFGFWGEGVCERLRQLQLSINKCMALIDRSVWMGGSFKVLVENGSKVVSQHLNNEVGAIINYTGVAPQYITPPVIQDFIFTYADSLIQKSFQQEGVSQLAASSLKPMGLNSGAALRDYDQIGDDRFLFIGQQMESFFLEIARQMIELAKEIPGYKVKYPGTLSFEEIAWKDIKLSEDEFTLKAFPTSSLPDEPAGKLQTVQEYMQAGLITPRAGRRLLAMPDVEMSDKLANAAENLLHKTFEDILDKGEYITPEPQMDLQLASTMYLDYYNFAKLNNCPEDRLDLIRQFKQQIDDLIQAAQPPPPPQMPMGAPQANPMPTPQSNLIPNVNPQQQG
jgi:hypothetical protein